MNHKSDLSVGSQFRSVGACPLAPRIICGRHENLHFMCRKVSRSVGRPVANGRGRFFAPIHFLVSRDADPKLEQK